MKVSIKQVPLQSSGTISIDDCHDNWYEPEMLDEDVIKYWRDQYEAIQNKKMYPTPSFSPSISPSASPSPVVTPVKSEDASVSEYLPPDVFKPFLRKLISKLNEDDAKQIIQLLVTALSKENPEVQLGKTIETIILTFGIDKLS